MEETSETAPQAESAHSFFRRGPAAARKQAVGSKAAPFAAGATIGEFLLVRLLGSGGMGEVWEAEQQPLGRSVALKLLPQGRVDERSVEYFAREARAGGRLSHPGIVSVHGAGEDDGVHWIAMELVEDGCTLADFLEQVRAEPELPEGYYDQVTGLTARVADALQAAHDEGVIHRDLKPQNILISARDEPLVSDFGLARVMDEQSLSRTGDFAGTYYYMSPEQVMARRIGLDHRTDVFSLGVVLYELLTLVRPFEGDTAHQVAEKITLEDQVDPRELRSRVPHDLAVICSRALEKRRDTRYGSMGEFAADLRRHLAHEPILARPPSVVHRARKWVHRNPTRSAVGAVAVSAFAMISWLLVVYVLTNRELELKRGELEDANANLIEERGLLKTVNADLVQKTAEAEASAAEAERQEGRAEASAYQAREQALLAQANEAAAKLEQQEAARQRAIAQAVNDFLNDDLLRSVAPSVEVGKGRVVTMREVLDAAATRIGGRFEGQPEIEARIRASIGQTYELLGEYSLAEEHQVRALDLCIHALGEEHSDTLTMKSRLASVLQELGKLDEAEDLCREVLGVRRRVLGAEDHLTINAIISFGDLLAERGDTEGAEPLCREALDLSRRVLGEEHVDTMRSLNLMGVLEELAGRLPEAEAHFRAAAEIGRRTLGENDPQTLYAIHGVGQTLLQQDFAAEAEPHVREALGGFRLVLGDLHPDTLKAMSNMGALLMLQNDLDAAEPYVREALEVARVVLGDEHLETLVKLTNLGSLLRVTGRMAEAESCLVEALAGFRRALGDEHPHTIGALSVLGVLLRQQGRLDEAEPYSLEALETSRRVLGDEHPSTLEHLLGMANLRYTQERFVEAEALYAEAVDGLRRVLGEGHRSTWFATYSMAVCLLPLGRLEDAEALLSELVSWVPESDPYFATFYALLQQVLAERASVDGDDG